MTKKQLSLLITLFIYVLIGLAAAGILFLMGTGKINPNAKAADSPAVIELNEKEAIAQANEEAALREAESAQASEDETTHYYRFTTTNRLTGLNVRLSPNLEATVIGRLSPGSTGYILEKGESWSKIKTDTLEGYASNEYLNLEEISKDEHPYY